MVSEKRFSLSDINPDLVVAANRFNETTNDGQEYDVRPELMCSLAEIGLVEHKGNGIYFQTDLMMEVKGEIKTLAERIIGRLVLSEIKNQNS